MLSIFRVRAGCALQPQALLHEFLSLSTCIPPRVIFCTCMAKVEGGHSMAAQTVAVLHRPPTCLALQAGYSGVQARLHASRLR